MNRKTWLLMLAVCTIAAQPAMAQSNLGFKRGGIAVSMVSPENIDATLGVGVFADMGTIAPRWGLESRLDWWSHSESFFNVDASVTDVTLGGRTKYQFPTSNPNVQPFMGAGLGIHFLSMEVGAIDPFSGLAFSTSASETRLGLDVGGGVTTAMNPSMNFHAEAWYGLVSDFNQFSLRVGLSRAFGQ